MAALTYQLPCRILTIIVYILLAIIWHGTLHRMREERIKEGEMSGLIQKTAEQNELEIMIKSYFAHDLQSFVTPFQGDVSVLEDNISKQLAVSVTM